MSGALSIGTADEPGPKANSTKAPRFIFRCPKPHIKAQVPFSEGAFARYCALCLFRSTRGPAFGFGADHRSVLRISVFGRPSAFAFGFRVFLFTLASIDRKRFPCSPEVPL